MAKYRADDVFIAGGRPELTYVVRNKPSPEDDFKRAMNNRGKLTVLTGPSKSGKTVLVRSILSRERAVWVHAGSVPNEEGLWNEIVSQLKGETSVDEIANSGRESRVGGSARGQARIPPVANAEGEISADTTTARSKGTRKSRSRSPKAAALSSLVDTQKPLVIDDFHFLDPDTRRSVVQGLRPHLFENLNVVLLAANHCRIDALGGMIGRTTTVRVRPWTHDELIKIPTMGFPRLNVDVERTVLSHLAEQCVGSPHLMQEFCREICIECDVNETSKTKIAIDQSTLNVDSLLRKIANNASTSVFERLDKGPAKSSPGTQFRHFDGSLSGLYGVVLRSIAELHPDVEVFEYEQIAESIRYVLDEREPAPELTEVSAVLTQITLIAEAEEESTSVLHWDAIERKLYVSEPFFAFCSKWGPYAAPIAT